MDSRRALCEWQRIEGYSSRPAVQKEGLRQARVCDRVLGSGSLRPAPQGSRVSLGLFSLRDHRSFCPRNPEDQDRPRLGALSRVGVCTRPPSPLPAGAPAHLPAPGWTRPRACVTAGLGAESCRAGHPAPVPRRARPLPAARRPLPAASRPLRRLCGAAGHPRARLGPPTSSLPRPIPGAAGPNRRRPPPG